MEYVAAKIQMFPSSIDGKQKTEKQKQKTELKGETLDLHRVARNRTLNECYMSAGCLNRGLDNLLSV